MRILTFVGIIALCGWLATTASAQVRDAAGNAVVPRGETNRATAGAAEKSGDSWRFVRYNNQWWYYLPSNQWLVWNGGRWIAPAELARQDVVDQQPYQSRFRGNQMYYPGQRIYQPYQSQPVQDPTLGRPIYRRFFPNMPFVPFPEDPTTSQPVTGAGQR